MPAKNIDVEQLLFGQVAHNTLISYVYAWKEYFKFAKSFANAMKGVTLNKWRQHLVVVGEYSAATVNSRIFAIKSIARELYSIGEISREDNWSIKEVRPLPKNALKERRRPFNRTRIEPEQMRAICTAPNVSVDNALALRDRALMMVLATTGVRISEACHMKTADIMELPGGRFAVCNVMGKRQAEPRTVPLSPEAHDAVLDWLEFRPVQSPYIFTAVSYSQDDGGILHNREPLKSSTAQMRITEYGERAGVPHVKPHDFRRFVGTQLAKTDIRQAQKVLGHASISTTATYYVMDEVGMGLTDNLF